jgi:hypothetical protein
MNHDVSSGTKGHSMRPSVVLLGFVLGSAAAITFALAGVAVVFAVLHRDYPRLGVELPTLLASLAMFAVLTALAGASFYGSAHDRPWRRVAVGGLLVALGLIGWLLWPR